MKTKILVVLILVLIVGVVGYVGFRSDKNDTRERNLLIIEQIFLPALNTKDGVILSNYIDFPIPREWFVSYAFCEEDCPQVLEKEDFFEYLTTEASDVDILKKALERISFEELLQSGFSERAWQEGVCTHTSSATVSSETLIISYRGGEFVEDVEGGFCSEFSQTFYFDLEKKDTMKLVDIQFAG